MFRARHIYIALQQFGIEVWNSKLVESVCNLRKSTYSSSPIARLLWFVPINLIESFM